MQSVEIAKREFDFCEEALSLLNKKPRVSRNVLQAYHREIMAIAKSFKQLFLDIAKEKEGCLFGAFYHAVDMRKRYWNSRAISRPRKRQGSRSTWTFRCELRS